MALKKKFKTRLDLIQEELDSQVYVVEDEKGNKVSNTRKSVSNKNIYTTGTQSRLQDNIAPIKTTTKSSSSRWKEGISPLPLAPSQGGSIVNLPNADPDAGRYLNLTVNRLDGKLLIKDTVTGRTFLQPKETEKNSLLDKTSITDRILGVNGSNNASLTGSFATSTNNDVLKTETTTNKDDSTRQAGITNEEGYTTTGLVYGDYWYQNYAKDKDKPIVEKDGKYYVYKGKSSSTGKGIYQLVDNMSFMSTKEQDKKDYDEAVKQGYTGGKNDVSKIVNQIKLDSSNLTDEKKKEYAEDLRRQEKNEEEEQKRKNEINYGGAGIKGAIGEIKTAIGNAGETIDENIIEPISNVKDTYDVGKKSEQLGMEAYKKMMGEENNYDKLKAEFDEYAKFNEDIVNSDKYLNQSIQSLPNQVGGILAGVDEGGPLSLIGAGAGALIGFGTTKTGAGALTGATTGAKVLGGAGYVKGQAEYTYKLEAGMQYQTLIEMGVPEEIAREEAQKVGTINALIESGESILDLVTLGQATKGKKLLLEGLKAKYGIDLVSDWVGKSTIQNIISEGAEEGLQEFTSISGEKSATEKAGIERDDSQDFERIKDSIIVGSLSSLLVGGSQSVVTNTTSKAITTHEINTEVNKRVEAYEKETGTKLTDEQVAEIKAGVEEAYKQRQETGYTQNEQIVIDSLVEEQSNSIAQQKAIENTVNEAITTRETEQGGTLSTKEKTALTESIKAKIESGEIEVSNGKLTNKEISKIRQEVENKLKQGQLDTNSIENILGKETDLSLDSYLQKSFQEQAKKSEAFTYDQTKVKNEQEKAVYDSAAKYFNDTTRSHEFVDRVAKISKDKGTNYGFINNEELKALGHDVEGKQVNGLVRVSKDGKQTVLINIDSNKALNTIVGHETTHLLEGTQEYKALQESIFNYAKDRGDFNTRETSLKKLYEGIENANINSELTADLVGDYLFTDSKFIDSLSTQNPTVFQKIKELIDDLVVRFTGTKEEQQLREVQKKFREAYRKNVATENVTTKETKSAKLNLTEQQLKIINGEVDVYHGTDADVTEMTSSKGKGMNFFSTNPKISKTYSKKGNVNSNRIKISNPLVIEGNGALYNQIEFQGGKYKTEQIANWARENGYDGVIFKDIVDQGGKNLSGIKQGESRVSDVFVTFDSNQSQVVEKGIKFSLTDNKGRTLTKEQQEYFKDSKVRDENGNLVTVYHGTNEDFNIFDRNLIDEETMLAEGFYFTKDKTHAEAYGNSQKEVYLDIKNPIRIPTISTQGLATAIYKTNPTKQIDLIDRDYGVVSTKKMTDYLMSNGYDGIITDDGNYVVFDSNQIKNIDNTNPTSNEDIRYSLGEAQESYFKDSKLRDENGNLKVVYHSTPNQFTVFDNSMVGENTGYGNTGFGTFVTGNKAFSERFKDIDNKGIKGSTMELYANVTNPITHPYKAGLKYGEEQASKIVEDYYKAIGETEALKEMQEMIEYDEADNLYDAYMNIAQTDSSSIYEYADSERSRLEKAGYDSVEIIEGYESELVEGSKSDEVVSSYAIFNSNQLKNIDNTNPTSNPDIRYSLTPEYGMSHRPSTDYGDASNFEENMPDVFEHPEWYFFGSDARSKKAYRESFEALKKVRNNPEGEITIYRATTGDTFNEGDWVSPSKTYAEWHNESNLDGKGKVIELKVKAKDIRFAGDDLNEFGYFPNGVDEYSLSRFNEQRAEAKGDYNVYGEDIKLEQAIAPLQEEIKELTETVQELKEQIAPVQSEQLDTAVNTKIAEIEYTQPSKAELDNIMALEKTGGTEYANAFFELRDKYGQRKLYKAIREYKKAPDTYEAPIKGDEYAPTPQNIVEQQRQDNFNNIDEVNMPSEMEDVTPDVENEIAPTKSLFETRNYEELGNRKINAYQYDNPEVKPFFREEAQAMLGDLKATIKGKRQYNDQLYYESGGEQGYTGTERLTTNDIAELLDGVDGKYKLTYADIEKGLNAIINDEGAENNATSKRIELYLDKRLREGYTTIDGIEIPANTRYLEMMEGLDITDYYKNLPATDDIAPIENVENSVENVSNSESIAPVKKLEKSTTRTTEASTPEAITKGYQLTIDGKAEKVIDRTAYKEIAEVLTEEPKTESDRNKRKLAIFKANILDKGIVFEDLSLKERNRELIAKWDYTLTSEARGQYAIGNGHNGLSKSLNDIRAEVDNTGNTKDFYNYMYHKHNVDRMTLDKRFGIENKPVFGESVTAEQSQAIVNEYEKTHPEFIDFAKDVYDYVNADKQLLVDNGVISQETADLWSKMYPHYVPTRRTTDTGLDVNVPLDTRRTGINAPIKKATGGSSDILPLFDTMAMRTLQTYRATAKNSFGVELKNTLGTTVESNQINVDEIIDSIDSQEGLLQEGKKGSNPTFTVFENGEKVTFEITKDMYDALKPVSESSFVSKTIKPLNTVSNVRRYLLTEGNPIFMLTNGAKDIQDVLLNSQHAAKTYAKIPEAYKQIATKGYWYQEYVRNGGERNSYFDNETNTFKTENKGLKKVLDLPPLSTISKINNFIEMSPRLAEYIASRESGRSIEVSMLDAARVTTNFKAGGDVTKWANRNFATFLNASVQGAMQQVRNVREAKANGVRGWVNLATKYAIAGLPALILNNLVWEDDDEYEELSDYVKQNYYVVGKTDDGTFIRIPKGRAVAVIQESLNQMQNLITGDDEADLKSFIDLTINNLAPNNPIDNNIFSPIIQVANNEAWYGGDLVPKRLQNLPDAEQYDESTDMFSRWIGEIFNVSPYKVNYLIDQYSGGVGDVVLPMITPEATNDADTTGDYLIAPFKSKFTTNSTFNNQNVSDFYDTKEKLTIQANKSNATDEDVLMNKYMNSVNAELNELYAQKREIQNSDLPKSEKYEQVKEIQEQINEITENALSEYTNVSNYSDYSMVGDREYYKRTNSEGEAEWTKVDNEEAEDLNSLGMSKNDKNTYFKTKSEISQIARDTDDSEDKKEQIIDSLLSSGMASKHKAYLYGKHYSSDKTLDKVIDSDIYFDDYLTFQKESLYMEDTETKVEHLYSSDMDSKTKEVLYETSVLSGFDNEDKYKDYKVAKATGIDIDSWLSYKKQEFVADKDSSGKSINGSRKDKIVSYINSLNLSIPQKAILIRQEYPSFDDYNNQIAQYVAGLDLAYEDKVSIIEELDMRVDEEGYVHW